MKVLVACEYSGKTRDSFISNKFDYKISLGSLIKFFYLEKYSAHDHLIDKNILTMVLGDVAIFFSFFYFKH